MISKGINTKSLFNSVKSSKLMTTASKYPALAIAGAAGISLGVARLAMPVDIFTPDRMDTGSNLGNAVANIAHPLGMIDLPRVSSKSLGSELYRSLSSFVVGDKSSSDVYGTAIGLGTIIGAAAGLATTLLIGAKRGFGPTKMSAFGKLALGTTIGAGAGMFGSAKAVSMTADVASKMHKQIHGLNQPKMDNRASGSGAGYRSWYKSPNGPMPVGHLGATGDLVLSMHKIRNQSII